MDIVTTFSNDKQGCQGRSLAQITHRLGFGKQMLPCHGTAVLSFESLWVPLIQAPGDIPSGFISSSQVHCPSPSPSSLLHNNPSFCNSLHVSPLPRGWNAWKGHTPLTFPNPGAAGTDPVPHSWNGMGQCQKPFRLSNIPLSSLHCLSRQRVSRHLLPQPVSSLGKEKKSHVPRYYIKYKWHEGFCHLADLLRGKRLSKDNEWLKWQGKKKSMISQRKK